jgi:hypothetical protein
MIHDFPKDDATGRPGAAELYNRGIERGVQSGQPLVKGMVLVEGEGRSFKGLKHGDALEALYQMVAQSKRNNASAGQQGGLGGSRGIKLVFADLEVLLLADKAKAQRQARQQKQHAGGRNARSRTRSSSGSFSGGGGSSPRSPGGRLQVGERVVVGGIASNPQLNGSVVTVVGFNAETERYNVRFSGGRDGGEAGKTIALKAEKLKRRSKSGSSGGGGGGGSSPRSGSSAGGAGGVRGRGKGQGPRAVLCALFRQYNPEKLQDVDTLLAKYKGKEQSLISAVRAKYEGVDAGWRDATVPSSPGGGNGNGNGNGNRNRTASSGSVDSTTGYGGGNRSVGGGRGGGAGGASPRQKQKKKLAMPPHLRHSYLSMTVKELQSELERSGVPSNQYENCLEKRELVALLLSRPPRARSMLGVLMSKKRLGQFHAMLQEAPGEKM